VVGLLDKVQKAQLHWSEFARPERIFIWILGTLNPAVVQNGCLREHLLVAGKNCTLLFGATIIVLGLFINSIRVTNLFDFVNQLASYLLIPLALPLVYGLFYQRTPGWSA
jgi:hypothetical protein